MCQKNASTEPEHEGGHANKSTVLGRWPEDPDASADLRCSPCRFIARQFQNWTFSYMSVVLRKGAEQRKAGAAHLGQEHLYVVPESMTSPILAASFAKFYQLFGSNEPMDDRTRLLKTLWKLAIPTYVPAGFCELVVVFCGTAIPLLVRELLRVLEENPNQRIISSGLPFAISIFCVSIINGFGNNRHRHLALKTGIALRAAIVNMIYQHVLQLSPEGKRNLTSGEVTNLVAVDTQKIYEVAQDGHLIWALPLSILLVSFFLYRTLGPSTLIGIAVLIGFVPIIERVSARMLKARSKRVKFTDQRIEIISNMLQGMKVAKLNNYESKYEQRVIEARNTELRHLRKEMAIWATTLCMTVVSPVLATAATFAAYIYMDENNLLTASDTFGVLLLFSALRFPISFAGRLIGKATQALSAVQRISVFLARPMRTQGEGLYDTGKTFISTESSAPLIVSRASFRVGSTLLDKGDVEGVVEDEDSNAVTGFTVTEFDFSVEKGEVMAICGPVGSGKSTLLNGILDEAEVLGESSVIKNGKLSYVPQTPFILNQTLRDNILFGLPYDKDRYERVLEACCLRPDLEQLGEAGDMTEIGERGVTLSGGQKQRVSLARAAYAKSSIVVLDDPFSALDSGTGRLVFERLLLSEDSLFRESAVILVTHAAHFISHRAVDKILMLVDGSNQFLGSWEDLASFEPTDENTKRAVDYIKSTVREDTEKENDSEEEYSNVEDKDEGTDKARGKLIQVEQREHGLSSIKTWLLWFRRAGGMPFFILQVLFMGLDRVVYVAIEWFLARWTSATVTPITILDIDFPAQTDGFSAQTKYIIVYCILMASMIVAVLLRSEWAVAGGGKIYLTWCLLLFFVFTHLIPLD